MDGTPFQFRQGCAAVFSLRDEAEQGHTGHVMTGRDPLRLGVRACPIYLRSLCLPSMCHTMGEQPHKLKGGGALYERGKINMYATSVYSITK